METEGHKKKGIGWDKWEKGQISRSRVAGRQCAGRHRSDAKGEAPVNHM